MFFSELYEDSNVRFVSNNNKTWHILNVKVSAHRKSWENSDFKELGLQKEKSKPANPMYFSSALMKLFTDILRKKDR